MYTSTKTRNHFVLVILIWDLMTGDIRWGGKRGILSQRDREDESFLAGTLLNPRSASTSTIARSRALIRSTIFMLVLSRVGGNILAALMRHKILQPCRAIYIGVAWYWNTYLMYDNRLWFLRWIISNISFNISFINNCRINNCEITISCHIKEMTSIYE